MSDGDELIITSEFTVPPLPMILNTTAVPAQVTIPDTNPVRIPEFVTNSITVSPESPIPESLIPESTLTTPSSTSSQESTEVFFWNKKEYRSLIIHSVCDVILFYLIFQYISNMFQRTKVIIQQCKESLHNLKEQYGLQLAQD